MTHFRSRLLTDKFSFGLLTTKPAHFTLCILSVILAAIFALLSWPAKAREARTTMHVAATVPKGCRASATPMEMAENEKDARRIPGYSKIKVRCGRAMAYSISLRGTAAAARSMVTRASSRIKQSARGVANLRTALTHKGKTSRLGQFIASARLQKAAYQQTVAKEIGGDPDSVIVAIDF